MANVVARAARAFSFDNLMGLGNMIKPSAGRRRVEDEREKEEEEEARRTSAARRAEDRDEEDENEDENEASRRASDDDDHPEHYEDDGKGSRRGEREEDENEASRRASDDDDDEDDDERRAEEREDDEEEMRRARGAGHGKALKAAQRAEQRRIGQILSSPHAAGRIATACHLACNTRLSLVEAVGVLRSTPATTGRGLGEAMSTLRRPKLGGDHQTAPKSRLSQAMKHVVDDVNRRRSRRLGPQS